MTTTERDAVIRQARTDAILAHKHGFAGANKYATVAEATLYKTEFYRVTAELKAAA